jgi:hypothetical protein
MRHSVTRTPALHQTQCGASVSRMSELCVCFTVYSRDSPIGVLRVRVTPYNQNYVNRLCYNYSRLSTFVESQITGRKYNNEKYHETLRANLNLHTLFMFHTFTSHDPQTRACGLRQELSPVPTRHAQRVRTAAGRLLLLFQQWRGRDCRSSRFR